MQALHITGGACLNQGLVALVEGNAADGRHLRRQRALGNFGRAYAQVLLNPRTDGDISLVAVPIGIDGYQHHVHEGRLGRLVELVARHHGVVVVQNFAAIGRVCVTRLDACGDVAAGGLFAFGNVLGQCLGCRWHGTCRSGRVGCGSGHAALHAQRIQAVSCCNGQYHGDHGGHGQGKSF